MHNRPWGPVGLKRKNKSVWSEMGVVSKMFSFQFHTQTYNGSKSSKTISSLCHTLFQRSDCAWEHQGWSFSTSALLPFGAGSSRLQRPWPLPTRCSVVTAKIVSRRCQMSWVGGGGWVEELSLVKHHWSVINKRLTMIFRAPKKYP